MSHSYPITLQCARKLLSTITQEYNKGDENFFIIVKHIESGKDHVITMSRPCEQGGSFSFIIEFTQKSDMDWVHAFPVQWKSDLENLLVSDYETYFGA